MGQAKNRRRKHSEVLAGCPTCIYCGGIRSAETVEHMPPRMMFDGRRRPKGLEFASCYKCNRGTAHADLVASLLGRVYPDANKDEQKEEIKKLLSGIKNNIPGLLEEMRIGRAGQKIARKRVGLSEDGGFLRVNGPLVSKYMQAFAVKLGFALHYHATQEIVPPQGGVVARWFSNVERWEGKFPDTIFKLLPPPTTLIQGTFKVSDQFEYSWRTSPDGSIGLYFATFRMSFAVTSFAAMEASRLLAVRPNNSEFRVYAPGDIAKAA